jgi:hypothetical protein
MGVACASSSLVKELLDGRSSDAFAITEGDVRNFSCVCQGIGMLPAYFEDLCEFLDGVDGVRHIHGWDSLQSD